MKIIFRRISGDKLLELLIFASAYILLRRLYSPGGGGEEENKSEKLCQQKHLKGKCKEKCAEVFSERK